VKAAWCVWPRQVVHRVVRRMRPNPSLHPHRYGRLRRPPRSGELKRQAAMNSLGPWTTEDFDSLAWHDVHVHGLRLTSFNESHGSADLVLDIDYIMKWESSGNGFQFTLCPAELVFHGVFGLKVELDYATPTAGMCPFSIHAIEREPLAFPGGSKSFRWHIPINWPHGSLRFEAAGFRLTLVGTPVVHSRQSLSPEQRTRAA